jgi:hypothetical protein
MKFEVKEIIVHVGLIANKYLLPANRQDVYVMKEIEFKGASWKNVVFDLYDKMIYIKQKEQQIDCCEMFDGLDMSELNSVLHENRFGLMSQWVDRSLLRMDIQYLDEERDYTLERLADYGLVFDGFKEGMDNIELVHRHLFEFLLGCPNTVI